jgi:hypothetical protein
MAEDEINEEEVEHEAEDVDVDDLDDDDDGAAPDDDDDDVVVDDDDEVENEAPKTRRKSTDDDDDDDELLDEDLDKILKDRLVVADEEEEEEADEPEPKGEGDERLQPKQQNEQLCSSCFLLVKTSAPNCPVGDDDCPIFS